jgi:Flp pilus assembly pilin Flp
MYTAMSGLFSVESPAAEMRPLQSFWRAQASTLAGDEGQDIAEYAVMLAVILVVALATIRLIGTNAGTIFSNVASSLQ